MKTRGSSSSISSSTRSKQPHFLFGLLGKEAETYADAYLVSQEGKRFPIVRSLLAMKCSFFKEKFFPGSIDRESHSDVGGPDDFLGDMDTEEVDDSDEAETTEKVEDVEDSSTKHEEESPAQDTVETSREVSENVIESPTKEMNESSGTDKVQEVEEIKAQSGDKRTSVNAPGFAPAANGSFQASGNMKPRYPMPFPMILLRQLVEFIYTDSVKFLDDIEAGMKPWRGAPDTSYSPTAPSCMVVSHIVELSRAADYAQLKELCARCCFILRMVVKAKRSTACAALGAIRRQKDNPFFLNKMSSLLVKYICGDIRKSFSVAPCSKSDIISQEASCPCFGSFGLCTVMHLNSAALEEVISAQTRGFSDEYMLQVVYFWASGGKRLSSLHAAVGPVSDGEGKTVAGDNMNEENYDAEEEDQTTMDLSTLPSSKQVTNSNPIEMEIRPRGIPLVAPKMATPDGEARFSEGKEITEKFNLSEMNPGFLYEYVEASGLVEKETLYNVYRFRALSGPKFTRIFSIRKKTCPPRCDKMGGTEVHNVS